MAVQSPSQVLFLDLGTQTGWALACPVPSISRTSGSKDFGAVAPNATQRHGRLAMRFCDWLSDLLQETEAERMVIERVGGSPFAGEAGRVLPGLSFVALGVAEVRGVPYEEMTDSAWKKTLTGYGKVTKQQIMSAVRQLGFAPSNQDEADAIGLRHGWMVKHQLSAAAIPLPMDLPIALKPPRPRKSRAKAKPQQAAA